MLQRLRRQAASAYPAESCGLLLGSARDDTGVVTEVVAARNVAPVPDRFEIAPMQIWQAMRRAADGGVCVLGVYHSHADAGAVPSPSDVAEAWGELLQVIIGCAAGEAGMPRCWRIHDGRPVEVAICQIGRCPDVAAALLEAGR